MYATYANVCRLANEAQIPYQKHSELEEYGGELMTKTRAAWLRAHPEEMSEFEGRLITQEHRNHLVIEKKKAATCEREQRLAAIKPLGNFFDLPFEIRENILKQAFPKTTAACFLPGLSGRRRTFISMHPLFWTSRLLRAEAILVFLEQTKLETHSGEGNQKLVQWLDTISFNTLQHNSIKTGVNAIRALAFPYFGRFPYRHLSATDPNRDVELMKAATHLQEFHLQFTYDALFRDPYNFFPIGLEELRKNFRLDGMLDLERIQNVVLRGPKFVRDEWCVKAIGNWLEKEYSKRGRKLVIEYD